MKKMGLFLVLFLTLAISGIGNCAPYADLMVFAHNPVFLDRIKYAMQQSALKVMAEQPDVVNHPGRLAYAIQILQGRASIDQMAVGVLIDPTIFQEANSKIGDFNSTIPDQDIQKAVDAEFDAFAGIGQ